MRTAKTLIRLCGCPGWSESSLDAQPFCWFCHEAVQINNETRGHRARKSLFLFITVMLILHYIKWIFWWERLRYQSYRYNKLRKAFSKFYRHHYDWFPNIMLDSNLFLNMACRNPNFMVTYCINLEKLLDDIMFLISWNRNVWCYATDCMPSG